MPIASLTLSSVSKIVSNRNASPERQQIGIPRPAGRGSERKRGAIILFDFRAAFPSLSHEYLWDALAAIGLPLDYINALQMFYRSNLHYIKVGGSCFKSVVVYSGVRQDYPLSPILFANPKFYIYLLVFVSYVIFASTL